MSPADVQPLTARSPEEQIAISANTGLHPLVRPGPGASVGGRRHATSRATSTSTLQIIEIDMPVPGRAQHGRHARPSAGCGWTSTRSRALLGVPVVPVCAQAGGGIDELAHGARRLLVTEPEPPAAPARVGSPRTPLYPEDDRSHVAETLPAAWHADRPCAAARSAGPVGAAVGRGAGRAAPASPRPCAAGASACRERSGPRARSRRRSFAARYDWIDSRTPPFLFRRRRPPELSLTDRVDRVLLNPAAGFVIFLLDGMGVVFQSLFSWADPAIGVIEAGCSVPWVQLRLATALLPEPASSPTSSRRRRG